MEFAFAEACAVDRADSAAVPADASEVPFPILSAEVSKVAFAKALPDPLAAAIEVAFAVAWA